MRNHWQSGFLFCNLELYTCPICFSIKAVNATHTNMCRDGRLPPCWQRDWLRNLDLCRHGRWRYDEADHPGLSKLLFCARMVPALGYLRAVSLQHFMASLRHCLWFPELQDQAFVRLNACPYQTRQATYSFSHRFLLQGILSSIYRRILSSRSFGEKTYSQ